MSTHTRYTLGRNERIKSRKKTELLFQSGKKLHIGPLRISYLCTNEAGLQVGVSAGKRYFKKAVQRNRVKRLLREAWRLQKDPLLRLTHQSALGLSAFLIYTGKEMPLFQPLFEQVGQAIQKLQHIVQKESATRDANNP